MVYSEILSHVFKKVDSLSGFSPDTNYSQLTRLAWLAGTGGQGLMGVVTKDARSLSAQAVTDMNGKEVRGRLLYVGRAQKRVERQNELKRRFEQMKQDRLTRYQVRVRPLVTAAAM